MNQKQFEVGVAAPTPKLISAQLFSIILHFPAQRIETTLGLFCVWPDAIVLWAAIIMGGEA